MLFDFIFSLHVSIHIRIILHLRTFVRLFGETVVCGDTTLHDKNTKNRVCVSRIAALPVDCSLFFYEAIDCTLIAISKVDFVRLV